MLLTCNGKVESNRGFGNNSAYIVYQYFYSTATWGDWYEWGQCSVSCGNDGTRTRVKECYDPAVTGGACDGEQPSETGDCNIVQCRQYSYWKFHFNKNRSCNLKVCQSYQMTIISTFFLSILSTATWGAWNEWSDCSVSCGNGIRIRMKECSDPDNTGGICEGEQHPETLQCYLAECRKYA